MNRLDEPVSLGYSSAGIVQAVGKGVDGFKVGDRVACVGAGFASHAEENWIPENLCVQLPENTSYEEGSFAMLGGIAMHGIRLAELTFGENVVVLGLGLLGLLSVQMLNAYGCNVIGIDIDERKVHAAKKLGARIGLVPGKDDVESTVLNLTQNNGADAVIITASSKDNAPIEVSENIVRKKGKIILVGVSDIHLTRKNFWEKEIHFAVSKAAGPGSLMPIYEQKNYDFPIDYVRWTEKRNIEQFVDLLSRKKVRVDDLITHRYKIEDAMHAYGMIMEGKERCIGVLLDYESEQKDCDIDLKLFTRKIIRDNDDQQLETVENNVGLVGGGMFTKNILLPALRKVKNINLKGVATTTGLTTSHIGKKYEFEYCTTNYKLITADKNINNVIITTRHDLHSSMAAEMLKAGKNVYVEKPLCTTMEELNDLCEIYRSSGDRKFMVGFNRRFSSIAKEAKSLFGLNFTPLVMNYRVNAGYIPKDHWTQDKHTGGGRIIGEVCHFIDFMQYLTGAHPVSVYAQSIEGNTGKFLKSDNVSINLKFDDGSSGTIIYASNGSKTFARERVEVFADDSVMVIDDFKQATVIKGGKKKTIKCMSQDMGYYDELDFFFNSERQAIDELFQGYIYTTLATFKAIESIESDAPVKIDIAEIWS
jgi:predicted dehydrogenase/threonine dehydrogenase-like Zn-dependent dehydrogenase